LAFCNGQAQSKKLLELLVQHDDNQNFNGWGVYYRLSLVTEFEYWYLVVPESTQYTPMTLNAADVIQSLEAMLE
jgi:hypothetical protein